MGSCALYCTGGDPLSHVYVVRELNITVGDAKDVFIAMPKGQIVGLYIKQFFLFLVLESRVVSCGKGNINQSINIYLSKYFTIK